MFVQVEDFLVVMAIVVGMVVEAMARVEGEDLEVAMIITAGVQDTAVRILFDLFNVPFSV